MKPTEVSSVDLEMLCKTIKERLFDVPSHPRSLLDDLEICIGAAVSILSENASITEISLSREMIVLIGRWLGNEERIKTLVSCTPVSDGVSSEQLSEQLLRDGMCEPSIQGLSSFYWYFCAIVDDPFSSGWKVLLNGPFCTSMIVHNLISLHFVSDSV